MKTKKMTLLALLTAIALTIFMLEAQIPSPVPIPGVKLGLANIVTVFTVFVLGPKEGAAVLAVRVFLGAVFAGNFSTILYSAAGGVCAIGVTSVPQNIGNLFGGMCAQKQTTAGQVVYAAVTYAFDLALLALSTIALVGSTYNAFLYFRF